MANSKLYDNKYSIPYDIIRNIKMYMSKYPNNNGIKRANNLVSNGYITYQSMKKLKNYFDYYDNNDKIQYELNGGELMKNFIENKLSNERFAVEQNKKYGSNNKMMNIDNSVNHNYMSENFNNDNSNKINNIIVLIFNKNNELLILKRSENTDWMPNKWGFLGGGINNNESPLEAAKREIYEELNINLSKFIECFQIIYDNLHNHYFVSSYDDNDEIKLNDENSEFKWINVNDINNYDTIPNQNEYIRLIFKNK